MDIKLIVLRTIKAFLDRAKMLLRRFLKANVCSTLFLANVGQVIVFKNFFILIKKKDLRYMDFSLPDY